jgi:hypothetical protein
LRPSWCRLSKVRSSPLNSLILIDSSGMISGVVVGGSVGGSVVGASVVVDDVEASVVVDVLGSVVLLVVVGAERKKKWKLKVGSNLW